MIVSLYYLCIPYTVVFQHRSDSTLLMSESSLKQSLTPFYSELFSLIARVEGGIKFLVDLRGDLLVSHPMSDRLFVAVLGSPHF